jgi:hypothetical protein
MQAIPERGADPTILWPSFLAVGPQTATSACRSPWQLEAARIFAHYEVEGDVVTDVGSRWRDGYGAVGVALVVAAVEDDGHGDAATVGSVAGTS